MRVGPGSRALALGAAVLVGGGAARAQESEAPAAVHGEDLGFECAECHTADGWREIRKDFEHASTGFVLRGLHRDVGCRECHSDLVFHRIGVACADCHEDWAHQGELGFDCRRCHDESGWRVSAALRFDHQQTRFPLLGRHATLDCLACHRALDENAHVGLTDDCFGCHVDDYTATRSPDHAQFALSPDCRECHSSGDVHWSDAVYAHVAVFPLRQGHRVGDCARCHEGGSPVATADDCYGCHAIDYASSRDPAHADNGFPTDCASCHGTSVFRDVRFYAHGPSGFSVIGPHARQTCADCHAGRGWAGIDRDCDACHPTPGLSARRLR